MHDGIQPGAASGEQTATAVNRNELAEDLQLYEIIWKAIITSLVLEELTD